MSNKKPLGIKNYGSIGHLPGSRMGPADHHCPEGQGTICTTLARDKFDKIIVQEKFDCPQCGNETKTLNEGYCEDCRKENQAQLDKHNAQYDEWNGMTDEQRDEAISTALRLQP